jgi:hypothetical protein
LALVLSGGKKMNRKGNPSIGMVVGAILGAVIGSVGITVTGTIYMMLLKAVGGDISALTRFWGPSGDGAGLVTGTGIASLFMGAWQGREQGGVAGGLIGGVTGPLLPIVVALIVVIWSVK